MTTMRRFVTSESGATSIEYAILSFIAVAIIAVVSSMGSTLGDLYQSVYEKVAGLGED
jgi:Flp pilus assembly pilin Flp